MDNAICLTVGWHYSFSHCLKFNLSHKIFREIGTCQIGLFFVLNNNPIPLKRPAIHDYNC